MLPRHVVIPIGLLLLMAPAHAEESGDPDGGDPDGSDADGGNETSASEQGAASQSSYTGGCEVVEWWGLARPTHVVVDPQECYLPPVVRELVANRT